MFSHQERVWAQWRQWERGWMMLSPWGQRLRHALRKLPKARPRRAAKIVPRMRIMCELSIRGWVCAYPTEAAKVSRSRFFDFAQNGLNGARRTRLYPKLTQVMIEMFIGQDGPIVRRHAPEEGVRMCGATGGACGGKAVDQAGQAFAFRV